MMNEKRVDILVYTNWMAPRTAQLDELRICTRKCRPVCLCLYSFVPCFAAQRPNQENWRKCGGAAAATDKNYSKDDQRRGKEKKPRTWGGGRRHEEGGRGRGRHRHSCPPCLAIGNRHTTEHHQDKKTHCSLLYAMNERMNIEDCDCENCTTFNRTQIRIARAQPHSSWEFSQIDRLSMKMKKVKKKIGKKIDGR